MESASSTEKSQSSELGSQIYTDKSSSDSEPKPEKIHLLSNPKKKTKEINLNFETPTMTFEERKYKRENLQKFQGKSSKSGVLGSLFSNKEERGLSKRFKQYTSILKSKYMQRTVDLEDVFCSRLVSTCSEFVRKLRAQALRSSVFIKPLFAGVAYSLLREECQGSEFLINLKDILRFLSPPPSQDQNQNGTGVFTQI